MLSLLIWKRKETAVFCLQILDLGEPTHWGIRIFLKHKGSLKHKETGLTHLTGADGMGAKENPYVLIQSLWLTPYSSGGDGILEYVTTLPST